MNPGIGILGCVIGALAGWIGSNLMGTNGQQGGVANIVIGVIGALVGGFGTHRFFGDNLGNGGLIVSFRGGAARQLHRDLRRQGLSRVRA
jgi:uncharacterized membrane protein YeaQ/YmgE (transglycosylase-associated protein family)